MVLVLDNYDSFTWNLVDLLRRYLPEVVVKRNDEITCAEALSLSIRGLLISPGPGRPADSGICLEILGKISPEIPVLGVCMGMQVMAEATGGRLKHALEPMHGRTSLIQHDGRGVFHQVPNPTEIMRYHSLVVDPETLSPDWVISARTREGEIMGMRHLNLPWEAVQFHPESVLSMDGPGMVQNWSEQVLTLTSG
ncbi:MAG: aminodeoxychorismate/anthranilate synthase component II [Bacteroidia bacterium]|nr:aminodeoxychorismate/anthranilate synthase component II [Bacteroidia bacterium]